MNADSRCVNCGRSWGSGRTCQWCGQIEGLAAGVTLCSPGKRLGGHLLEGLLAVGTLGVGWLVWALIVFSNGQTPAKQLLGMRAITLVTGQRSGWGRTAVREVFAKWLVGSLLGFLVIPYFWLLWDKDHQQLWDKIVGTVVVNDGGAGDVPAPGRQARWWVGPLSLGVVLFLFAYLFHIFTAQLYLASLACFGIALAMGIIGWRRPAR